ncbi:hypothetical protein RCL_jg24130.t1 [Rhizophagus clarus]|uniref:Crinkler effector protein N-terminal domain-containing protein n=1 Tax=Rhizophagus clarus TaxID=94130 RepID=A0A8H3LF76_9GLOM|nr:hypothetical protein RCL_jg24130.t1 [Rhizophagus clarus]
MTKPPRTSLWYKYENHDPVRLRISVLPSLDEEPAVSDIRKIITDTYKDLNPINISLEISPSTGTDYVQLNEVLFGSCDYNYDTLRSNYNIAIDNPIIVKKTEIWCRYKDQVFSFKRSILEIMKSFIVEDLIKLIQIRMKNIIENIDQRVITLRRGCEVLNPITPLSELYNIKNNALEIVVYGQAIWCRYEDQVFSFERSTLENTESFNVVDLIKLIQIRMKNIIENIDQRVITLRRGSEVLNFMTPLSELYNIKNNALEVVVDGIGRNCFPRPSVNAEYFIKSLENTANPMYWFNIFLAKAVSLVKETELAPDKFWEDHLNDDGESIWKPAIDAANRHEKSKQEELVVIFNNWNYLTENFQTESDIEILLCVDEGRTLLQSDNKNLRTSLFRCWRRALRENRWRAKGLFSVILDTTSQVSHFASSPGNDPTIKTIVDYKLFMPFIYIISFDSLTELPDMDNFDFIKLFSKGRPCWKAFKDAYYNDLTPNTDSSSNIMDEIYAWNKVKTLVMAKLQGGNIDFNVIDEENKNLTSVAVLASLCSVNISPSVVHIASNLVASHLGTCLAISQDRTKVLVSYPSEPLITEAAYEILNDVILNRIASALGQGIVESDKHGVVVGELILILTRQRLQKRRIKDNEINFFVEEIKIMDFLVDLFGKTNMFNDDDDQHNYFRDANISFTRFVTICTIPTLRDVQIGYETCVAFNLKRNHKGADFLIPIRNNNKFTFWIIQIKNHNIKSTGSNFQIDTTSKLMPRYVFDKSDLGNREKFKEPYLAISAIFSDQDPKPTTHYAISGLNSFEVARGKILAGLRAILNAYVDPYDEI